VKTFQLSSFGFQTERINGVGVASVFGLVTCNRPPKPSRVDRIFRGVLEAVLVFGPDIAIGMEMAYLRDTALREGMGIPQPDSYTLPAHWWVRVLKPLRPFPCRV